jgi:hypothetical protein
MRDLGQGGEVTGAFFIRRCDIGIGYGSCGSSLLGVGKAIELGRNARSGAKELFVAFLVATLRRVRFVELLSRSSVRVRNSFGYSGVLLRLPFSDNV